MGLPSRTWTLVPLDKLLLSDDGKGDTAEKAMAALEKARAAAASAEDLKLNEGEREAQEEKNVKLE